MAEAPKPPQEPGGDPSMEDILASIRRILSEEEAPQGGAGAKPPSDPGDVLVLDPSMMVPEEHTVPEATEPHHEPAAEPHAAPERHPAAPAEPVMAVPSDPEPPPAPVTSAAAPSPETIAPSSLVAPEAAAAAASSVGALMRTLASERGLSVSRGGPSLEDIVREELRPLLKAWLDSNLPPLVERLVRAEIERVVGRAAP
jgi:uncharacterized protein